MAGLSALPSGPGMPARRTRAAALLVVALGWPFAVLALECNAVRPPGRSSRPRR